MLERSLHLHRGTARPLLAGEPLEQHVGGRTCGQDDCHTRLSRYNPSNVCAEHAGWRDVRAGRRRAGHGSGDGV